MTAVTSLSHRGNNMAGGAEPRRPAGHSWKRRRKKKRKKKKKEEAAPLSREHDGKLSSLDVQQQGRLHHHHHAHYRSCSCLVSKATVSQGGEVMGCGHHEVR